jgi:hypothetical protein
MDVFGQENMNKFIYIEWEKNSLASEYHLQISDSIKFLDILYQKKTKDSVVRLEPNPKYKYGRIAGIDQYGVRGEYSEIFEIEQRIVEKKAPTPIIPLPSNYLSENHTISLLLNDDKSKGWITYYKINDGKWLTYNDGIRLSHQGLNLIQYYSEDRLGNREKTKTMEYILDTQGPFIEVSFSNTYEDKDKFLFTGKKSSITLSVSDLYSGILSVKTYLRTSNEFFEIEWDPKKSISIPENLSEKILELKVIATDRLGNVNVYSKFFKHDLAPPSLVIESTVKLDGEARQISISRLSADDSYSGVENIFYSLNNSPLQSYLEPIVISEPGEYEIKILAIDRMGNKSAFQYERVFIPDPASKNKSLKK